MHDMYSTCTSNCAEMYHMTPARAPDIAKAIAVFLFQCRGLHHQPPAGDHTYLGYSKCLVPPCMYPVHKDVIKHTTMHLQDPCMCNILALPYQYGALRKKKGNQIGFMILIIFLGTEFKSACDLVRLIT